MKKHSKMVLTIAMIALVVMSFLAGSYMTEQKNSDARIERCRTLIMFAIDKAENGDLTDQGTMRGLISNVYAAYQFCDNSKSANQLHDLWNYLVFESDGSTAVGAEIALRELNAVLHSIKMTD